MDRRKFLKQSAEVVGTVLLGGLGCNSETSKDLEYLERSENGKAITLSYCYEIDPPEARMGHDPNETVARQEKPFGPAHLYLQTTDEEGFVQPYGRPKWLNGTKCRMTVLTDKPLAIESTCRVEGFGQVMCRADNEGQMYDPAQWKQGEHLLFDLEAARSEVAFCKNRLLAYQQRGFVFEADIANELDQAESLLKRAEKKVRHEDILAEANRALGLALNISEKLTLARAYQRLVRLETKRPFSFGSFLYVRGDSWATDPVFAKRYLGIFNSATVSVFHNRVQPKNQTEYIWQDYDRKFGFIRSHGLEGIGHCLGWPATLPQWVLEDQRHLLEHNQRFAAATLQRYGDLAKLWAIMNEVHDWKHAWPEQFNPTLDERVALFKGLRDYMVAQRPGVVVEADTCVTNAAWRATRPQWPVGPKEWYNALSTGSVKDFVIGLQIYHGAGEYATFDMGRLARHLEVFAKFGLPMHLYVETPGGYSDNTRMRVNGAWHGKWSEVTQANWWQQFLTIVLAEPLIRGITIVTLGDGNAFWLPYAGFCREDLSPKPVYNLLNMVLDQYVVRDLRVSW